MLSYDDYKTSAASLTFRNQCWIDGAFVPAASGETFASINPATGKLLWEVPAGMLDGDANIRGKMFDEIKEETGIIIDKAR